MHAQYEDGSLVGTVRDGSGAAVSGATVTTTNNATGLVSKATTNGEGDYEFPALKVGVYSISASATGFADAVAKHYRIGGRTRTATASRQSRLVESTARRWLIPT